MVYSVFSSVGFVGIYCRLDEIQALMNKYDTIRFLICHHTLELDGQKQVWAITYSEQKGVAHISADEVDAQRVYDKLVNAGMISRGSLSEYVIDVGKVRSDLMENILEFTNRINRGMTDLTVDDVLHQLLNDENSSQISSVNILDYIIEAGDFM